MAAITDAYITADEYRSAKGDSAREGVGDLEDDIAAVCQLIDAITHQAFTKDAAVVNRTWWGDGSARLKVWGQNNCPGIATATGLIVKIDRDNDGSFADETAVASGDYELWPPHAALGREPQPYREIVLHGLGSVTDTYWPKGHRVHTSILSTSVPDSGPLEATCQV